MHRAVEDTMVPAYLDIELSEPEKGEVSQNLFDIFTTIVVGLSYWYQA